MRIWTYGELRKKVENDLDLVDELFISPAELMGYANAAVEEAEAEIIKINEDYLLTRAPVSLIQGQATYSMPPNIYANKVRGIEYINGSIYYPVRRIRNYQKFDRIQDSGYLATSNQDYQWYPVSDSPEGGQKMTFVPAAVETTATGVQVSIANPAVFTTSLPHGLSVGKEIYLWTNGSLPTGLKNGRIYMVSTVVDTLNFRVVEVPGGPEIITTGTQSGTHSFEVFPFRITCWFIRAANRFFSDSDVCDIPQFANFILQTMKKSCYEKEPGHPNYQQAIIDQQKQRDLMIQTLTEMVPDDDNKIEADYGHYLEHS